MYIYENDMSGYWSPVIDPAGRVDLRFTVGNREIGTGISEASKKVPIFPFDTQGGKQASSYFRQRNWVQAREAQIRFPAG